MCRTKLLGGALALLFATTASAQLFKPQNPNGPRGLAEQTNYPYPGQCVVDPIANPWGVPACTPATAPSFACTGTPASSNFTSDGYRQCGTVAPYIPLLPALADSVAAAPALPTPRFVHEVLNPPDYLPDTTTFPGADYYEIGLHEAYGFQSLAATGLFPNPLNPALNPAGGPGVPNGMQWTGLVCTAAAGCTCPADLAPAFEAAYCSGPVNVVTGRPTIPQGRPLFTPIWGVGQMNVSGGPVSIVLRDLLGTCSDTGALCWDGGVGAPQGVADPLGNLASALPLCNAPATCTKLGLFAAGAASPWSNNDYVATWPSISIRATKGRPVVVRWVNEFPNNHIFCPHPEAADWPCAIDRTFMGVKAKIDPALGGAFAAGFPAIGTDGVNQYGSPQQPDNSWVTHLHGGDIPPSTDGFAMKWFGNKVTGPLYSPAAAHVSPHFDGPPSAPHVMRPGGPYTATSIQSAANDTYTYPMNQEEALIWFHDHTLGKTHHNVIAGPAGFFPVKDPLKHGPVAGGVCSAAWLAANPGGSCDYTWLDPVTEPRDFLTIPRYDYFFAIQDRAFNDDGSINFSNGIGQGVANINNPVGLTVLTDPGGVVNGVNPDVHPTWVPEYFGDHVLINGVTWPKATVASGWYRIRFANGSDSRCYTFGLSTTLPAPGTRPVNNVRFTVIASDQGYLPVPKQNVQTFSFCPGERYELLVNFGAIPGRAAGAAGPVYLTNWAAAPFPNGALPTVGVDGDVNVVMKFDVNPALKGTGVPTCPAAGLTYDAVAEAGLNWPSKGCIKIPVAADPNFVELRASAGVASQWLNPDGTPIMCGGALVAPNCVSAVRHLYLNERVDGLTAAPLGMQINGVPFEYKVTETPRNDTVEVWKIINLTVDAHPMHPHLVKHLRVSTQRLNVGAYKRALCGSTTCQPGTAPGNEMQLVPDVEALGAAGFPAFLIGNPVMQLATDFNGGYKDASVSLPGQVTTIIAHWAGNWTPAATPTAPGTVAAATCLSAPGTCAAPYTYEPVTTGPYVWHCHINSHEDSEMMRTSLVVP